MFLLHETTRRRVVRTAFLLLCVGPTLAVTAWLVHGVRPWRLADEQARLGGLLHVSATLSDWQTPRPGVLRIQQLVLTDSAAATPLAELTGVTLDRRGRVAKVVAESASLEAGQLPALAAKLPHWFKQCEGPSLEIGVSRLNVRRGADDSIEFFDVAVRVDWTADGALTARLLTRASGAPDAATVSVQWDRPANDEQVADHVVIDARRAPLPCWLLGSVAPVLGAGGEDALFTGNLQLDLRGVAAEGTAQGRLNRVALAGVLPQGSPHHIHGSADMTIEELRWRGRQIERLAGTVRAANVSASKSLLEAAARFLYCPSVGTASESTTLDRVACRFQLDRRGLTVTGAFPPDAALPAGCLAETAGQAVLIQPPYVELPAGAWVQLVAAPAASWVPATQEAIEVAERMPLPNGLQPAR